MRGAVFLDRDGVLNAAIVREGKPYPPASADEVVILPGVVAAIEEFHRAELVCVVVSNQPDVARGALSVEHLRFDQLARRRCDGCRHRHDMHSRRR